jgi:hypothetical protein
VFSKGKKSASSSRRTVSEDWIAWLPREKAHLFEAIVRRWESSYAMMSVSLDDAFSLRARGELICARRQVAMSADLMIPLGELLIGACGVLSNRGRSLSNLPAVEPLNTDFFRGETAQTAASWNEFLHKVLFAERSRFFQKLRILSETLENLVLEYDVAAQAVAAGISVQPVRSWDALECLHYDFNTCLRETEVVLKSFLRAMPGEEVPALATELETRRSAKHLRAKMGSGARVISASA